MPQFDDSIDVSDLLKIISLWGTNDPTADFDDSGIIDILDFTGRHQRLGQLPVTIRVTPHSIYNTTAPRPMPGWCVNLPSGDLSNGP